MSMHDKIRTTQAIIFILFSVPVVTLSQQSSGSIHLSLIYRDSYPSPYYDPRQSAYDRVKNSFVRSQGRLAYLLNRDPETDDFQREIEADDGEYFVNYFVGTPPFKMLAVLDTASELVLTRCLSSDNSLFNQTISLFNPSNSSTFRKVYCTSQTCSMLPNFACDQRILCSFDYGYADFSGFSSLLGIDVFTFHSSSGFDSSIMNVNFGCKRDPEGVSARNHGILGLGFHNLSLIMQLSRLTEPMFTYCFGNNSNPDAENRLILGSGIFPEGQTTSLKVINGKYTLVLEGISIGRQQLQIASNVFQGGLIIDTGTTLTFLDPDAYYVLADELGRQLKLDIKIWPDPPYERCYTGKVSDISEFQGLIFHLDQGVNVLFDVPNLFLQVEDGLFCLAVLPSPVRGTSVLGTLFQQTYSVGYNLGNMTLSFQRIDCDLIDKNLAASGSRLDPKTKRINPPGIRD